MEKKLQREEKFRCQTDKEKDNNITAMIPSHMFVVVWSKKRLTIQRQNRTITINIGAELFILSFSPTLSIFLAVITKNIDIITELTFNHKS